MRANEAYTVRRDHGPLSKSPLVGLDIEGLLLSLQASPSVDDEAAALTSKSSARLGCVIRGARMSFGSACSKARGERVRVRAGE